MTTEQKLQAIIDAQVKGGCETFAGIVMESESGDCWFHEMGVRYSVPEILLDPAGLKAAYEMLGLAERNGRFVLAKVEVAHQILDKWLSTNGDAASTIETAYSLLPDSD